MLLNDANPLRIGDLRVAGGVDHVQRVDGCARLRVNSIKRYYDIFAVEAAEDIVKQTDAVWRLKLNERVSRMRLVVDCNARRKFNSYCGTTARAFRFFDGRCEVKALVLEGSAQRLLDKLKIAPIGNGLRFRIGHAENAKHRVIAARENVGAQNVQWHHRKCARYFSQKPFALPRAECHHG